MSGRRVIAGRLPRRRFRGVDRRRRLIERELARMATIFPTMGLEKAILFGSAARGRTHAASDIDLILVKETSLDRPRRVSEAEKALAPKVAVDILVYTPAEFDALLSVGHFVRHAVHEGRFLYGGPVDLPPSRVDVVAEGRGWYAEALDHLEVALILHRANHWSLACFHAQQATELSLKAFLHSRGRHRVRTHSTVALLEYAVALEPSLAALQPHAENLKDYYLSTRYPNGSESDCPPGIRPRSRRHRRSLPRPGFAEPRLAFGPEQAEAALAAARRILDVTGGLIPQENR